MNKVKTPEFNTRKMHKKPREWGVGTVFIYIFMILFALICLFPFVYELLLSFSTQSDYLNATFLVIPSSLSFESYKYIFYQGRTFIAFGISSFTTIVGTVFTMFFSIMGGYILSKEDMPGRKIFITLLLITMFFDGGLVPFYLTVKNLKMTNSLSSLIIPFAVSAFDMILLKNFFKAVPKDVLEAAELDGAGQMRVLFQFVVPLSLAGIATITMFTIVAKWNDWYWPLIFLTLNEDLFPLALELRNVLMTDQTREITGKVDTTKLFGQGTNAAMVMITILPIIIIYPFLQKFFVQGQMLGASKE